MPNGLTLSTVDTPKDSCNTLCIINGQFLVLTVDSDTYVRLGLVGKRASSRYHSKDHYFISVPLKGSSSTNKLLNRVRECLKEVIPISLYIILSDCTVVDEMHVWRRRRRNRVSPFVYRAAC